MQDHPGGAMRIRMQSERERKLLKLIYDCTDAPGGRKVGYFYGDYSFLKGCKELVTSGGKVWSKEAVRQTLRGLKKKEMVEIYHVDDEGNSVACDKMETRKHGHLVAERRIVLTPVAVATLIHYYPRSIAVREAVNPKTWWQPGEGYDQDASQVKDQATREASGQASHQGTLLKGTEAQDNFQGHACVNPKPARQIDDVLAGLRGRMSPGSLDLVAERYLRSEGRVLVFSDYLPGHLQALLTRILEPGELRFESTALLEAV